MPGEYLPILMLGVVATTIGFSVVLLSDLLGPKKYSDEKYIPYECGISPKGRPRHSFHVKYYLVALLFLIFDVEVVFLFPWAVVFKKFIPLGPVLLYEMLFFMAFLIVGFLYAWKRGAFDWGKGEE